MVERKDKKKKIGQKGQIFCFWSDGLFRLPSIRAPYKVSFGKNNIFLRFIL